MNNIIKSRRDLPRPKFIKKIEKEGGCGVTGFICSIPVAGRHIFEPSIQMHNRGNGKGGGIAAFSLDNSFLGVSEEILKKDYLLNIAILDNSVIEDLENKFINPYFKIDKREKLLTLKDFREIGLEIKPPDVYRYFVRVKDTILDDFIAKNQLKDKKGAEDEFVFQNSFRINNEYYASLGEKKAFVLSHGRNMFILKIVGYAEQIVKYYKLEDFKANIWISHQRYPTRGRVWHPGGAHPFIGMNEALVHNGDFANYYAITEYLKQRNYYPQFLTDTELAALLFDLLNRVYGYPLEYIIEALAPTTELDFERLPREKKEIYRLIQSHHISSSPDGPWFFIIGRNNVLEDSFQLIGITDTSMLRPQVFALYDGDIQIGLICSEKQAIDATLHSLSREDKRFCEIADRYWNARGGSFSDGGAFIFTLKNGRLFTTDKFGKEILIPKKRPPSFPLKISKREPIELSLKECDYSHFKAFIKKMEEKRDIGALTRLYDIPFDTGNKKTSWVLSFIKETLYSIFDASNTYLDWEKRDYLKTLKANQSLIINGRDFPAEGENSLAKFIVKGYSLGFSRFILYNLCGQRFIGCGLGPNTKGVRIDVYGSPGDYLASGIDGLEIYVHSNAQDQLAQIMNSGKLVVYGDVGQTFMYGAKGGEAYILGNTAGRPLINACGSPRVVINGTSLDFLGESFMAGDPLNGGGFVILNGIRFNDKGEIEELETPYPGGNLFSLASGGAIYVRDPHHKLIKEQLNGGEFTELTTSDWKVILPYLKENERLFGISIEKDLLVVDGVKKKPEDVYRKIRAIKLAVLTDVEGEE